MAAAVLDSQVTDFKQTCRGAHDDAASMSTWMHRVSRPGAGAVTGMVPLPHSVVAYRHREWKWQPAGQADAGGTVPGIAGSVPVTGARCGLAASSASVYGWRGEA